MGYRGRLIFPVLARIAPLDLEATAADPGLDPEFRAPRRVADGSQLGTSGRREGTARDVRCQVEDDSWEQLQMMRTGDAEAIAVTLVLHLADLEAAGLVDATTGEATFPRKGDRLVSIHRIDGALIEAVPTPPGLYCIHAAPRSHGLSGGTRNLLVCRFEARETSSQKA